MARIKWLDRIGLLARYPDTFVHVGVFQIPGWTCLPCTLRRLKQTQREKFSRSSPYFVSDLNFRKQNRDKPPKDQLPFKITTVLTSMTVSVRSDEIGTCIISSSKLSLTSTSILFGW